MNTDFVNPFLDSIVNVLSTMARVTATPQDPFVKEDFSSRGDVTGLVGLAGKQARASLAISFPEGAILQIASRMLGEDFEMLDETVANLVGEITNMVSGGAKGILSEKGYHFDMAIPSTIIGRNHTVDHKTAGAIVVVPFGSDAGSFYVEVCLEEKTGNA